MKNNKDITDEEIERVYDPFNNNLKDYMTKYVIPEIISFQIANANYRKCLSNSSLLQHYNSFRDVFNVFPTLDEVKDEIVKLLRIKYNLKIINEKPLTLKRWE